MHVPLGRFLWISGHNGGRAIACNETRNKLTAGCVIKRKHARRGPQEGCVCSCRLKQIAIGGRPGVALVSHRLCTLRVRRIAASVPCSS